ncbi:MAG: DUF86 domain-containing protein [Deltaproteobacteria bacterium]|nr:DUF86 domain-containing protein [Deltaproteobacteria bacterium]MBI5809754.1 DUF86 domain-containing protein [Deltaproteobacteria bacterium]
MKRDVSVFLTDVKESIARIADYTRGIEKEKFLRDTQVQDAVIRRLEVIGEAVKNIPDDVREKYPDVRWAQIAGLRDVLIHAYFGVNLERVWLVVEKDLPELKANIVKILKDSKRSGK